MFLLFQSVLGYTHSRNIKLQIKRVTTSPVFSHVFTTLGGGTSYNHGLHGDVPSERGTFLRLEVYKRVGISGGEQIEKGKVKS